MVKPETGNAGERSTDQSKYKGVRKRKWGKWVSEIRLPNSRERIWLGSYDSAEKAARAFDAALFCLRGPTAKFNFPDNAPDIPNGRSLNPAQIRVAATQYANSEASGISSRTEDHQSLSSSTSSSSMEMHVESPSPSVSDGPAQPGRETPVDGSFLDLFATMGSGHNATGGGSFDLFQDFVDYSNDFLLPPPPSVDYGEDNYDITYSSEDSFLWNF
ncbi:hypothetical protein NMG60_11013695 [Bertholletia excelsa]